MNKLHFGQQQFLPKILHHFFLRVLRHVKNIAVVAA